MPVVLVLAEVAAGRPSRPTCELLTLARRIGEPVAVVLGPGGAEAAAGLGEFAAARFLTVGDPSFRAYLLATHAEALAQVVAAEQPAAVLVTSSAEGKEIAARLAVKIGSGLITDAVDVDADGSTTQNVLAGGYRVRAKVTHGIPVVTVKANAVD